MFGIRAIGQGEKTGLQYGRSRWSSPNAGVFQTSEPIGFKGGDENLYRYVANDPVSLTDPSGLEIPPRGGYPNPPENPPPPGYINPDYRFRLLARKNGVPDAWIDYLMGEISNTGVWIFAPNHCQRYATALSNNIDKGAAGGANGGIINITITAWDTGATIWPRHSAVEVTFKDGTVAYIDNGAMQYFFVNDHYDEWSHFFMPSEVPPSWKPSGGTSNAPTTK